MRKQNRSRGSWVMGYGLWVIKPITCHLSPVARLFTSHVLRLTFLTLCTLHFAICSSASAAPHITRGKPEPPSKVGKHLSERMKAKMFAPMLANATTGTVKVLFLKVDFPADTDISTTGDGTWADPAYANSGKSDFWINNNKIGFENYYNEVSFGQLTLQVDVFPSAPGTAYRLSNPMVSYGNESGTALGNLISESITKADTDIDFSQYQAVLIVHAGREKRRTPPQIRLMTYGLFIGHNQRLSSLRMARHSARPSSCPRQGHRTAAPLIRSAYMSMSSATGSAFLTSIILTLFRPISGTVWGNGA